MTAVCVGCGLPILDRYVLEAVPGLLQWHAACLRCTECGRLIDETSRTCFLRQRSVYCTHDFHRSVYLVNGCHIPNAADYLPRICNCFNAVVLIIERQWETHH